MNENSEGWWLERGRKDPWMGTLGFNKTNNERHLSGILLINFFL